MHDEEDPYRQGRRQVVRIGMATDSLSSWKKLVLVVVTKFGVQCGGGLTWDRSARGPRNKGGVSRRGGRRKKELSEETREEGVAGQVKGSFP